MIGAGVYAKAMLLPPLKAAGVEFRTIATASGVSARDIAAKYNFHHCAADADEVINDNEVNLVVVATRHDLHAELARRALERGRHVFVEKPLCRTVDELARIKAALEANRSLHLASNLVLRGADLYRWLREEIASGAFGDSTQWFPKTHDCRPLRSKPSAPKATTASA